MKRLINLLSAATISTLLFPSCAVIVGGSKYTAYVTTADNATITYNGREIGKKTAQVSIPRKDAGRVSFQVSKDGCPTETYEFNRRVFRGWSAVGSFMLAPVASGVPLPVWNVIDIATGACYKPDRRNPQITKGDYKGYYYDLEYNCDSKGEKPGSPSNSINESPNSKEQKLIELKELFDKGMITEEEYNKSRATILAQ